MATDAATGHLVINATLLRDAGFQPPDIRKGDRMHSEELEPLSPASADYV